MNPLFAAAVEVQAFLETRRWPHCYIGGLAVLCWGEMRATQDIDLLVLTGFGREELLVRDLIGRFPSRVPDPLEFALANRVALLTASSGVPVDLSMGGIPFEEEVIGRASRHGLAPGVDLQVCSAEDLVVLKAFADRARDWADIEGVLLRSGSGLDWTYVRRQLEPLCAVKEAPHIPVQLEELRRRCR